MKAILASLFAFAATVSGPAPKPVVDYRFELVRRSVDLETAKQKVAATRGLKAESGDKIHTGWFSYALITSESHRARFEIFASTDVELAAGQPGVLLSLERGRLHAIFDKITGNEPRIVKTPGALLAVRGTEYSVNVATNGETTLDVFDGIVEVQSPLRTEPLFVRRGEAATFSRRELPPQAHPMEPGMKPDGSHPRVGQDQPRDGSRRTDPPGAGPRPSGPNDSGRHQPGMPSPMPPSSPPPTRHR
ncbi:MAG: FecR domain-containing protein [Acidobacteriota bacterium]